MTPRELIEKWELEADEAEKIEGEPIAPEDGQISEISRKHAAELRAALPEQPLSRKWREEAERQLTYIKNHADVLDDPLSAPFRQKAADLNRCAADLDAQHDEDREWLRQAADKLEQAGSYEYQLHGTTTCYVRADRIRKYLEGESDEA